MASSSVRMNANTRYALARGQASLSRPRIARLVGAQKVNTAILAPVSFAPLLDRLPTPPIVVFAGDLLTVSGDTCHAVVAVAAEFTRLVTCSLVAERVARSR